MPVAVSMLVMVSLLFLGRALSDRRAEGALSLLLPPDSAPASRWSLGGARLRPLKLTLMRALAALGGAAFGLVVAGPVGIATGAVAGWAVPRLLERRRRRRIEEKLEGQLAEVVETVASAVRSGLSIAQAVEFCATDADAPIEPLLQQLVAERSVGAPVERALEAFADALGTDDGRLFVLILTIHQRSGGNVAGALEEVASTIRHRVAVRRELRALTAQGRVSGSILGALPIGFFLVLATTSRGELAPIYRSTAGIAMLGVGLVLEALAYVWIRRLLRVQI